MIAIAKGVAPAVLRTRGAEETAALCKLYDDNPSVYADGTRSFEFKDGVYGHATVRAELKRVQYGKCAFCEVVIPEPYADGHVEHFRPKSAVKQARGEEALRPGYYWLAYEWSNLLLSCQFCNRSNKGVLFPLEDEAARARSHRALIELERPLLIKPDDGTDPLDHIEFVEDLPRGRSDLGSRTIEVLGLDRLDHRAREDVLVGLQEALLQVRRFNDDPSAAGRLLVDQGWRLYQTAILPKAPFSAMAAAFVAANPLPPRS